MDEKLKRAAEEFGKALSGIPAVQDFLRAAQQSSEDEDALRLKAELDATYDDLIQRQSRGEVLARGEIEAYYELEQRVRRHPLLAEHDSSLEDLKDTFSEAHNLLSSRLGLHFKDLVD